MSGPESENVYQRLAREQQQKALRFLVWIVLPLSAVVAVYWLATGGPYRQAVIILVGFTVAVVVLALEARRKRRNSR